MKFDPSVYNIRTNDIEGFVWSRLQRYHNIDWVSGRIVDIHEVDKKYIHFARSQAAEISFCVRQAHEYFKAASIADISVSPLLLYYGITSLSTALILFNMDGKYRLSKIRQNYGSHGLKFFINPITDKPSISQLVAKEDNSGLYQLFRKAIGSDYVLGVEKTIVPGGTTTRKTTILIEDISLYDSYKHTKSLGSLISSYPDCYWHCRKYGLNSDLVRVSIERAVRDNNSYVISLTVQPDDTNKIEKMSNSILCQPKSFPYITVSEFPQGYNAKFQHYIDFDYSVNYPPTFRDSHGGLYFSSNQCYMRQVCILYMISFIQGMYSRYYPDMWTKNINKSDEIYLATYDTNRIIAEMFPLFILQELEFEMYYNDLLS